MKEVNVIIYPDKEAFSVKEPIVHGNVTTYNTLFEYMPGKFGKLHPRARLNTRRWLRAIEIKDNESPEIAVIVTIFAHFERTK